MVKDQDIAETYAAIPSGGGTLEQVEQYNKIYNNLVDFENGFPDAGPNGITYAQNHVFSAHLQTVSRDSTRLFKTLSTQEKMLFWDLISQNRFQFTNIPRHRGIKTVLNAMLKYGNMSDDLKTTLFGANTDSWVLAEWHYDRYAQEQRVTWKGADVALAKVAASRDPLTTWNIFETLLLATEFFARDSNEFLTKLHPDSITPEFANSLLQARESNPPYQFKVSVIIKFLRKAYDLAESIPDEWIMKAFL